MASKNIITGRKDEMSKALKHRDMAIWIPTVMTHTGMHSGEMRVSEIEWTAKRDVARHFEFSFIYKGTHALKGVSTIVT